MLHEHKTEISEIFEKHASIVTKFLVLRLNTKRYNSNMRMAETV